MTLKRLETDLGHDFGQVGLLKQALTHRSFGIDHNERLEFLGDSVLNCVIADLLYLRFPKLKEGELHLLRVSLVRQEAIAEIAQKLNLGDLLRLGEGELKSGGARRPSTLADAMEAVFGAIYLDAGFAAAKATIERLYGATIARIVPSEAGKDPKTALQELLQGKRLSLPRYSLLATRGEAHKQEFEVECVVADLGVRSTGIGSTRRVAEQQAASRAIAGIKP